jgi:MOSC domain-containing protein YiiM
MKQGKILAIHIASDSTTASATSITSVESVRAVLGRGLEGDRYFHNKGFYSKTPGPDREVTLIEIEAIERFNRNFQPNISPADLRRNIVTQGISLNWLVDKEFLIGGVCLKGIRLCEPCVYLASILGVTEIMIGLKHQGGLRAQILSEGIIRVNDTVKSLEDN